MLGDKVVATVTSNEILLNLTFCGVILVKYARGQSCCHGDQQCNDNFKIFINDPKRELFGPKVQLLQGAFLRNALGDKV